VAESISVRVVGIEAFERQVPFRFPFRFGAARVDAADQVFVRLTLRDASGREATGWAAEMLMPKWFDKSPDLSPAENTEQLRASLRLAMQAALTADEGTPFGLHATIEPHHHASCAQAGLNGLIAAYGLALVDRAAIDAVGRLEDAPAADLVRSNRLGITAETASELSDFDLNGFLAGLSVPTSIKVRHTVGLGDALDAGDLSTRRNDGLPETLEEVIAAYGHDTFKLKLSGDVDADIERLKRIAAIIERHRPEYRATLDGNEQFADQDAVMAFLDAFEATPELSELAKRLLLLEQPIARSEALSAPVTDIAARMLLEIDESDANMAAFPRARELGYRGVSAKSCKGFYRAILNRARIAKWNAETKGSPYFMSAEDLTTQSGTSVQQDLVLAGLIGATHVERNGHHFVDGMANAPNAEQAAFMEAHGDLYQTTHGRTRLKIREGALDLTSVAAASGLGSAVEPDFEAMTPMGAGGN